MGINWRLLRGIAGRYAALSLGSMGFVMCCWNVQHPVALVTMLVLSVVLWLVLTGAEYRREQSILEGAASSDDDAYQELG